MKTAFPRIMEMLDGPSFREAVGEWAKIIEQGGVRALELAVENRTLKQRDLAVFLCVPMQISCAQLDSRVATMEHDICRLLGALGTEAVRGAFRNKLLADGHLEDTRYEIAAAATCIDFLDANTLSLEAPLVGSTRNTDICGLRQGKEHRLEVTVIHDDWPPSESLPNILSGCCHKAHLSRTMESQEWDDIRSPGTRAFGDPPGRPRSREHPPSTKIWHILDQKRKQFSLHERAVNVIVLGKPNTVFDDAVEDSLFGVQYAEKPILPDGTMGELVYLRKHNGPFTPEIYLKVPEDVARFVDPFRIVSAVWLLRLLSYGPISKVFVNPNASCPLSDTDKEEIERLGMIRGER
jgi:hypothetical protein